MPLFFYLAFVLLCGFYPLKLYIFSCNYFAFFFLFLGVDRAALVTKTDYISAKKSSNNGKIRVRERETDVRTDIIIMLS